MAEENEEPPKHPYVTDSNAKVHLIFSAVILALSLLLIILGIVISEKIVTEIYYNSMSYNTNSYYNNDDYHEYFYGDSIWIGFVGVILAALGGSVYRTKSRSNGVMQSVMLFICGFLIYPTSACLTGINMVYIYNNGRADKYDTIQGIRVASAIIQAITAIVVITYAFYAAMHSCCNSKVRKQQRLNIPAGAIQVQQPVPQMMQQQPQMVIMQDGTQGYIVPTQPGYGGQQMYVQQPQPGYAATAPPQYTQQAPPANIAIAQVPPQVQHGQQQVALPGAAAGTPDSGSQPPAYSEA